MFFKNNTLVLWNYKNHEQFEIGIEHIKELVKISKGEDVPADIESMFRKADLFVDDDGADQQWCWDILSKIFHIGTKNIPISAIENASPDEWIKEYLDYCNEIGDPPQRKVVQRKGFELPQPSDKLLKSSSLQDVLYKRKTCREFYDKPTSLSELSNILYFSFGYIHGNWNEEFTQIGLEPTAKRKSSPSGGGLHPVEAYVVALNVDGLENDIYYYNPDHHNLEKLGSANINLKDSLTELLWGQYYSKGISFGVFLTGRMDLAAWKYKHSRAYRNVLLDVGHLSQTFQLCATAEGLNTWITGAFNDSEIENIISIDGVNESVLFFVCAGYGNPVAFDQKMKEIVSELD